MSVPAVYVVPILDLQQQELTVLDKLLDRARTGTGRQVLGGVHLRIEEEGASAEQSLGIDDPARLLVGRQLRRVVGGPDAELGLVEPGDDGERAIADSIGDDPRDVIVVTRVLLDQDVPVAIDEFQIGRASCRERVSSVV